jgi:hypothetical protein
MMIEDNGMGFQLRKLSIQGLPAMTITNLTDLAIPQAIDIAIQLLALLSPPTHLTGSQKNNDFGLLFERFNLLKWQPSSSSGVTGYNVYRNRSKIATVNAATFSYEDHNVKKGVTTNYSISAFNASGNESTLANITIN